MSGHNGVGAQIRKAKAIKQAGKEENHLSGTCYQELRHIGSSQGHYDMHILIPTLQMTNRSSEKDRSKVPQQANSKDGFEPRSDV